MGAARNRWVFTSPKRWFSYVEGTCNSIGEWMSHPMQLGLQEKEISRMCHSMDAFSPGIQIAQDVLSMAQVGKNRYIAGKRAINSTA